MAKRRPRGEGSFYFSKSRNRWVAKVFLPNGKQLYKYAKTQREVRDWLLETRKLLKDGLIVEPNRVILSEFIDRWFENVAKPKLRESTILAHESLIRVHIKPALGAIRLNQLSPIHLQDFYANELKRGLSKKTVKYLHTILYQSLGQAVKWGLVAKNVALMVDVPTPTRRPVEPLTQIQVAKLLERVMNYSTAVQP